MQEVSLALQTNKPLEKYSGLGRDIEDMGFSQISVYNDLWYQPAWYPLYELVKATSDIKIGVAAVNPFLTHPVHIAAQYILLHQLAPGRIQLGIARGAWLDELGIDPKLPIAKIRETMKIIHQLCNKQTVDTDLSHFPMPESRQFQWAYKAFTPNILLGSWGLKTFEQCFPFIHEIKLGGTSNPDVVRHFNKLAEKFSKQFSQEVVSVVAGAVTVVDEDGEKAKNLAKREVSLYLPVVASLDPTLNLPHDVLDEISKAAKIQDYATAAQFIDDDLLEKFVFAGTPSDIIKQSKELFTAGVGRLEFGTPHGLDSSHGIKLLGKEVLPEIRGNFNE